MSKRIVITGMGVVSPVGIGVEKFRAAIEAGRSGIDYISGYSTGDFPVNFAAAVRDFNASDFLPRKVIKVMARDIQLACAAAKLAVDDSALNREAIPSSRIGVSLGAGLINADLNELGMVAIHSINNDGAFDIRKFGEEGIRELMPLWLLKQLPNMPSSHVSIIHNAHGPSNSIITGCSSSILSIGESMRVIKNDNADVMLSGGADSKVNPLSILRFYLLKLLAQGWREPQKASRPFDKQRNGIVAGEGAGVVVLEELSHARARGANIYAEVKGFGASFSNKADRKESIEGKMRAMQTAIDSAGIDKEDIGLISAHGVSTRDDDYEEREAIQRLFCEKARTIPVIAPKSIIGYPGAASGVFGLFAAILAIKYGIITPNINYIEREDGDLLDHVSAARRSADINYAMVNAFGIGGHNGVIIVRRAE